LGGTLCLHYLVLCLQSREPLRTVCKLCEHTGHASRTCFVSHTACTSCSTGIGSWYVSM